MSTLKNIFDASVTAETIHRINRLTPDTKGLWGKMTVAQMLAHCCVMYEFIYEPDKHAKPGAFKKFLLKLFVKNMVVNEKPYKKSIPTAPEFLVKEDKDFSIEKDRLVQFIIKTQQLGEAQFDGRESRSFGKLSITEWNNMFYKHLDHHLQQFGV
jgi:hypothetical protein